MTQPTLQNSGAFEIHNSGTAVALCLHGLTSTPNEVRKIGEALLERGIAAVAPLLAGHGTSPSDLEHVRYRDWIAETEAHFTRLQARYKSVFVVGSSLGGLLGLHLATMHPVAALAVVATPLRVEGRLAPFVPILKYFVRNYVKKNGADIRDEQAARTHLNYPVIPVRAIHELQRLQCCVRRRLHRVHAPILVAHGALDRVANPQNANEILAKVASEDREHFLLASSGHVATVDVDSGVLAQAIADFFVSRKARNRSRS